MKKYFLQIFLILLRSLIYLKRAVVWLFFSFLGLGRRILGAYRRHLAYRVYKIKPFIKKVLSALNISWGDDWLDTVGRRTTLQVVLFVVAVVVMIPHSQLYTRESQTVAGRDTLLYQLVGPGQFDFELEEIEVDVTELAKRGTRTWREGVVVDDGQLYGTDASQFFTEPREIAGVSAGGSAVTKPTIIPGAELPSTPGSQKKRTEVIYHTVQPGDIIGHIAEQYQLDVISILWANDLSLRSYIRPGDKLAILPVDGVVHKVEKNDTVTKIAKYYDADTSDIIEFNRLQEGGQDIVIGEELLVPGGKKPTPRYVAPRQTGSFSSLVPPAPSVNAPAGSGYIWPTAVRRITQYYGWRHTGLDVGGPYGTPIYAARGGRVSRSQCGWNGGYGCYIIIDHGDGVQTLYAHESRLYVSVGQQVTQGQTIALMGSTGRSTGPHVHFEVRVFGRKQNPLRYIR
jgi:LysM repeat protein